MAAIVASNSGEAASQIAAIKIPIDHVRYIYIKIVFATVAHLKGCWGEFAAGSTRLCGKGQGGRMIRRRGGGLKNGNAECLKRSSARRIERSGRREGESPCEGGGLHGGLGVVASRNRFSKSCKGIGSERLGSGDALLACSTSRTLRKERAPITCK